MALEGKKTYWDEEICEEARLTDIDEGKVKWYLERKQTMRRARKPKKMKLKTLSYKSNIVSVNV